jgi:SpoVK/Ycf46/Vps4 family AAA+-type ATPase
LAIPGEHVKALIKRHIDGDDDGFYSVAMQLAARAARQGRNRFAMELRELIDSARAPTIAPQHRPTPLAQPRGELAGLMSVSYPEVALREMVLAGPVQKQLRRVVSEQRQRDRLAQHGLDPVHRLLLLGLPGTGKSMSAGALAHELHLPLFTIQLHVLISRYMGETAAKLRLVFDAAASTRAVYLFDEFDALGAERMAQNDVGEARRVLNSFLQFMDTASPSSLIVAATNHPQLLDRALFRRFDLVVHLDLPSQQAAVEVIQRRLALIDTESVDWEVVAHNTEGMSPADLVRAAEVAAKGSVLQGAQGIRTENLVAAITERRRQGDG